MNAKLLPCHGVVFDCDGTLFDSEQVWLETCQSLLIELQLDVAIIGELRGITASEAASRLARWTTFSPVELAQVINERYSAGLKRINEPLEGVKSLLQSIVGSVPLAIATNGRRQDVEAMLHRVDITQFFDTLVTIEDVRIGKPSPDVYLEACRRLQLEPHSVVAFEDSEVGAQSASKAGCSVIGLGNGIPDTLIVERVRGLVDVAFEAKRRMIYLRESGKSA